MHQHTRGMANTFYLDCSQCSKVGEFVRALARAVGVRNRGTLYEIKTEIKAHLNSPEIDKPLVILDEAGDLDQSVYKVVKELWNATEVVPGQPTCGWYMIGAQGLENKINIGRKWGKNSFPELFSRFSEPL